MYADHLHRHRITATRLLAACVVVSFVLSALSIAYAAGRQQAIEAPATSAAASR
jgi:hypothetical protein